MEQQVFLCPLCNAPHDEKLQPGTLQVKCKYCGGLIVVPSRLSGLYQECPDHPESQSVGLCTQCGRNCCDVCLHVFERFRNYTRYLCPECTKAAVRSESMQQRLLVASFLIFFMPLPVIVVGYGMRVDVFVTIVVIGALLAVTTVLAEAVPKRVSSSSVVPTLREKRQEVTTGSWYSRERCPHCNGEYYYPLSEIQSVGAVTCEHCGRRFEVVEPPDTTEAIR